MSEFLFGDEYSTVATLGIVMCLMMAFGIPLADVSSFRQAGLGANLFWLIFWLISVPGLCYTLYTQHGVRKQLRLLKIFA